MRQNTTQSKFSKLNRAGISNLFRARCISYSNKSLRQLQFIYRYFALRVSQKKHGFVVFFVRLQKHATDVMLKSFM